MDAENKLFRALDANLNRCREGIRTVEDIFRFIYPDDFLRKKLRYLRHQLDIIAKGKLRTYLLASRNVKEDKGKQPDKMEMKRKNVADVLYVNFQRAKEATRVMEELFKLTNPATAKIVKKLRYDLYRTEKETFKRWPSLFGS